MLKTKKFRYLAIVATFALLFASELSGQDSINLEDLFTTGISIKYGTGYYSVKDEFISKEKYSGILPFYSAEWARFHNRHGYRLEFEYRLSNSIRNNNITSEAQQLAFNQDFIYPVGNISLFSKDIYFFLGPSLQYWYYQIKYDFVRPGTFIFSKTFGNMGSLGFGAEFIYPVSKKLKIDGFLRTNLISVSGKLIDEEAYNESSPRFVTVLTSAKLDFDLLAYYNLVSGISASLGYKFDLSRINRWDPYIAASDNLVITLNYKF
jgi:hypothetical protein